MKWYIIGKFKILKWERLCLPKISKEDSWQNYDRRCRSWIILCLSAFKWPSHPPITPPGRGMWKWMAWSANSKVNCSFCGVYWNSIPFYVPMQSGSDTIKWEPGDVGGSNLLRIQKVLTFSRNQDFSLVSNDLYCAHESELVLTCDVGTTFLCMGRWQLGLGKLESSEITKRVIAKVQSG